MWYKILDSRQDGEDVITTVAFKGDGKDGFVNLEVRHIKPVSMEEVIANIDEMEQTAQHPKEKIKEQEARASEIVQELKGKSDL